MIRCAGWLKTVSRAEDKCVVGRGEVWQLCAVVPTLSPTLGLATDSHQNEHFTTVNLATSCYSAPRQDTLLGAIVLRFLFVPIEVRIESCHLSH